MECTLDSKLDYITRILWKTKDKRIENYVIGRIWHTLNDWDVKMKGQQYVKRSDGRYALTDIYFPQIGLHVEVNEPAHYSSAEQIHADDIRRAEIEANTSHTVMSIDCTGNMGAIHAQVDKVVHYIRNAVATQRAEGTFNPWNPEFENSPAFYQQKGYLAAAENVQLNTIEDICKLFNARFVKRGFLRPGAADHPTDTTMMLWWPAVSRKGWENELAEEAVIERHTNPERMDAHVRGSLATKRTQRAVFFKHRDELGYSFYRFKGIYELDPSNTSTENGVVWKKKSDTYALNN